MCVPIVGAGMVLVTPGIRPSGAAAGDQKRIMTPAAAIAAGADYLVVGRPIIAAPEPRAVAEAIVAEIAQTSRQGDMTMAKGYWIGRVDVHDEEGYKPYAAANPAIFRKYGGRFVVRAGKFECTEGESRTRNVVIEFPDYDIGSRLLPLAGIPGQYQSAPAACDRRHDHCRRLRRPAAVVP